MTISRKGLFVWVSGVGVISRIVSEFLDLDYQ
jgi:hypothetical protein